MKWSLSPPDGRTPPYLSSCYIYIYMIYLSEVCTHGVFSLIPYSLILNTVTVSGGKVFRPQNHDFYNRKSPRSRTIRMFRRNFTNQVQGCCCHRLYNDVASCCKYCDCDRNKSHVHHLWIQLIEKQLFGKRRFSYTSLFEWPLSVLTVHLLYLIAKDRETKNKTKNDGVSLLSWRKKESMKSDPESCKLTIRSEQFGDEPVKGQ